MSFCWTCRAIRARCSSPTPRSTSAPIWRPRTTSCRTRSIWPTLWGSPRRRVAILSAVETVNPKMPSTIDAAALCKMADRGQITGGLVDGPLAFDNAISLEAAKTKGIVSDGGGPRRHPGGAGSGSRQHDRQAAALSGGSRCGRHRARRARTDHPDQPRRQMCAPAWRRARVAALVADNRRAGGCREPWHLPMRDAIVVLNVGFFQHQVFAVRTPGGGVSPICCVDRSRASARRRTFVSKSPVGSVRKEASWSGRYLSRPRRGHGLPVPYGCAMSSAACHFGRGRPPGGPRRPPVPGARRIDDAVLADLENLSPLAPLHQPHNLAGIRALAGACPTCPRSPVSIPRFTAPIRSWPSVFALPRSI